MKNNKLIKLICGMMTGVMFILVVMGVLVATGVISLGKTDLVLKTYGAESLYNGSPLVNKTFDVEKVTEALKDGHRIEYSFPNSQTDVGECVNELEYKIVDELGADVTSDYNIKHDFGVLKVNPRRILIICDDTGDQPPREDQFIVSNSKDYDGLAANHTVGFVLNTNEQENDMTDESLDDESQNIGSGRWKPCIWSAGGAEVTKNYHIILTIKGAGVQLDNSGSGGQDNELFNGDTDFVPPVGSENKKLYSVYSDTDGRVYLKAESYGAYNGRGWETATGYNNQIDGKYAASYLTSIALQQAAEEAGITSHTIEIEPFYKWYVLPYYLSTEGENEIQNWDTYNKGDITEKYTAEYYWFVDGAQHTSESVTEYENTYRNFVKNEYLVIDEETRVYMNGIISEQNFDISDTDIINKVANYIQGAAKYDLDYNRELDAENNVAIAFLDEYKEGVCSHYATSATLLYRALGIPARYTVGVSVTLKAGETVDVFMSNAHAWVEVYVDGLGWKCIEVTGTLSGEDLDVGDMPDSECPHENTTLNENCTLVCVDCGMPVAVGQHDMYDVARQDPTCTENGCEAYKKCSRCGYEQGYKEIDALGHDWENATCETPNTCERCGETEGDPLGHDWVDATCTEPKTCQRCGETEGEPLGHDWVDATCTEPKTCQRCGETEGEPLGHDWVDATCTEPKTCQRCGEIEGEPLGHDWQETSYTASGCLTDGERVYTCVREGCEASYTEIIPAAHDFADATCTRPRTCQREGCGAEEGEPLGHEWTDATCTEPKTCKRCGETEGEPLGHDVFVDENDGYKRKCKRCGCTIETENGGYNPSTGVPNPNNIIYIIKAETTGRIYLRIQSRGDYVGNDWSTGIADFSELYNGTLSFSPNYFASIVAQNMGAEANNVTILSYTGEYALPYYLGMGNGYSIQIGDTYYKGNTSDKYTVPYYEYDFLNNTPAALSGEYAALELIYRDFVYGAYTERDQATSSLLEDIISEKGWAFDRNGSYESKAKLIKDVAAFVSTYRPYDTSFKSEYLNSASNIAYAFFDKSQDSESGAVCYHYATAATLLYRELGIPARIVFGAVADAKAGEEVQVGENRGHAWVEIYMDGYGWIMVEVTGGSDGSGGSGEDPGDSGEDPGGSGEDPGGPQFLRVTITPFTIRLPFNGTEQQVSQKNRGKVEGLPNNYTCEFVVFGSGTEAGKHTLDIKDVVIKDENNNDVTHLYDIDAKHGTLQIYYSELVFSSSSFPEPHIYDGTIPEEYKEYQWVGGTFIPEHTNIQFVYTCTADTGFGINSNKFTVTVYSNGVDVTDCYYITYHYGDIEIEQRNIVIQTGSGSAEWVEDSEEYFSWEQYEVIGELPADNHKIVAEDWAKLKLSSFEDIENTVTIKIVDKNTGEDVTDNYSITILTGWLELL